VTLAAAGVILGLLLGQLGAKIIGHWLADVRHIQAPAVTIACELLQLARIVQKPNMNVLENDIIYYRHTDAQSVNF